jgi:hypothetical protein
LHSLAVTPVEYRFGCAYALAWFNAWHVTAHGLNQ